MNNQLRTKHLFLCVLSFILIGNASEVNYKAPSAELSFGHSNGSIVELYSGRENYWLEDEVLKTEKLEYYDKEDISTQEYKAIFKYPFLKSFWLTFEIEKGAGEYKVDNQIYGGGFEYSFSNATDEGRFSPNKISTDIGLGIAESKEVKTYIVNWNTEYSFTNFLLVRMGFNRGLLFNSLYQQQSIGLSARVPLTSSILKIINFDGAKQSVVLDINHHFYNTDREKGHKMSYKMLFPLSSYATWFYGLEHVLFTPKRADYATFNLGVKIYVH